MPKYDAKNFDPPAPVAYVTLRNPATGASLSDVPMLVDTGADITLLPDESLQELGVEAADKMYEIQGFDGEPKLAKAVNLEMNFLGRKFSGQFLLINQSLGILGRNVLNSVSIMLDGPRANWDEYKR